MKDIKLTTEVATPKARFGIGYDDAMLLVGSCFTENMGARLSDLGFKVNVNPLGIMYNPLSMADALSRCLDGRTIGEGDLVERDGLWHSWLHHGCFSHADKDGCLHACNQAIEEAHDFLETCNTVILTFGSGWHYRLKSDGRVVANCHKVPAATFEKRLATVEESLGVWNPLMERLLEGGRRVVLTISPVRHQAYGAHGNQLGKAVLLLMVEELMRNFESKGCLEYFPSYEIVVDELRDYRFYADDMAHPSSMAEEIVWRRFQNVFFDDKTKMKSEAAYDELRRKAHRPLRPGE